MQRDRQNGRGSKTTKRKTEAAQGPTSEKRMEQCTSTSQLGGPIGKKKWECAISTRQGRKGDFVPRKMPRTRNCMGYSIRRTWVGMHFDEACRVGCRLYRVGGERVRSPGEKFVINLRWQTGNGATRGYFPDLFEPEAGKE